MVQKNLGEFGFNEKKVKLVLISSEIIRLKKLIRQYEDEIVRLRMLRRDIQNETNT